MSFDIVLRGGGGFFRLSCPTSVAAADSADLCPTSLTKQCRNPVKHLICLYTLFVVYLPFGLLISSNVSHVIRNNGTDFTVQPLVHLGRVSRCDVLFAALFALDNCWFYEEP